MKVSVIIPVYNVFPYVKDCLDSVLGQTLKDLEIICIHDQGQDGSWEWVKERTAGDGRVRLVENEVNLGLAATRNRGLDLAKGDYIYFLDSDDMICLNALETLWLRAERDQAEVLVFGASYIYENEELREKFKFSPSGFKREYPEILDGKRLFRAWMEDWDWLSSQPRYFYSRRFLKDNQIRFTEGMLHEDETFAFDVLMNAERMGVFSDPLFIRRFRPGSIMTSIPTMKNVEGCVKILDHVSSISDRYIKDPALNSAVKFYMYKIFCDAARKYCRAASLLQEKGQKAPAETLSQEMGCDPGEMNLFHVIEAFGLWGDEK